MKKIYLLFALFSFLITVSLSAQSFEFMNRHVVFGSTPESFLETFPEFSMDPQYIFENQTGATYIHSLDNCTVNYLILFENSSLVSFLLRSDCTMMEDESIINGILDQFTFIPPNDPDEEMGDVIETYVKGNLTASAFIGGFYQLTITRSE